MKTLGLIGGTSWVSTIDYYRLINQYINDRLGGLASAKLFMYSVNYEEFKKLGDSGNWDAIAHIVTDAAKKLQTAGAECIIICANTPHKTAPVVQAAIQIPLIHIAEVTAAEINKQQIGKVGLLGTKFTMEENFITGILAGHGIETCVPDADDRNFIHETIYSELGKGVFMPETKARYIDIINKLVAMGARGIIFGCTEIPLLLRQRDCPVPVFDTMVIHARAAVDFALADK